MTDGPPPDLSPSQLDAVLAFLPAFTQPTEPFGRWVTQPGHVPYYEPGAALTGLARAVFAQQFAYVFDWVSWQAAAEPFVREPHRLAQADLLILRRLMTLHVRADRFNEGHLGAVAESGHLGALLQRLAEIRQQWPGPPAGTGE